MNERTLRNQLEQLQTDGQALEAELVVDHGPLFLAARDQAHTKLRDVQGELRELDRKVSSAEAEESAARAQVEHMDAELRAVEQQQLSAVPFVLMPVMFAVTAFLLISGLPLAPAAFACAASLGFLFGPRVAKWVRPSTQRGPLAPNLTRTFRDNVWRNRGALALTINGATSAAADVRSGNPFSFSSNSQSRRTLTPPASRSGRNSSGDAAPANAAEPIIPGAKRDPSSFIHATISTGRRSFVPDSTIACTASRPASTP